MKWPCITENEILFFTILEPVLVAGFRSAETRLCLHTQKGSTRSPPPRHELSQRYP